MFHTDIQTEQAVLGAILREPVRFDDVFAILPRVELFQQPAHRLIYEAMIEICGTDVVLDALVLAQKLHEKSNLEKVGGRVYLVDIIEDTRGATDPTVHAQKVAEKARLRRLQLAGEKLTSACKEPGASSVAIIDSTERELMEIVETGRRREPSSVGSLLPEALQRIESYQQPEGREDRIMTGFPGVDKILQGFRPGRFCVLGGRPSHGKTQLALQIAEHAARMGSPVLFVTMEMPTIDLEGRLLCTISRVDSARAESGELVQADWDAIARAQARLQDSPCYLITWPGITISELRSLVRRQKRRLGIKLVVVDYIQIMDAGEYESRQVAVSQLSCGLKTLSVDADVAVLACSQLRRFDDRGAERRPRLSGLRESGSLEQDADDVLFVYHKGTSKTPEQEIIVAKHRNGPTGFVPMSFVYGRWENPARSDEMYDQQQTF